MKIYNDDYIKIYNGDCLEVLKNNDFKIDKIITSPPYNIIRPNSTDRGYDLYKDGMSNKEYSKWITDIITEVDKHLNKNGCIIMNLSYGTENTTVMNETVYKILQDTNYTIADIIIWKKKSATPNNVSSNKMTRICEFVYVFCRKEEFYTFTANKKVLKQRETGQDIYENVFNFFEASNNDESTDINKATFSSDFVEQIINRYVNKTDTVLDMFNGTGTTTYACKRRGIKSIGIELSSKQCEYAKKRITENDQISIYQL